VNPGSLLVISVALLKPGGVISSNGHVTASKGSYNEVSTTGRKQVLVYRGTSKLRKCLAMSIKVLKRKWRRKFYFASPLLMIIYTYALTVSANVTVTLHPLTSVVLILNEYAVPARAVGVPVMIPALVIEIPTGNVPPVTSYTNGEAPTPPTALAPA
jgi:hypothetical protein